MKTTCTLLLLVLGLAARAQSVEFYGSPSSIISSGAVIPEGKKMLWTSGITAGVADSSAQAGTAARFGDTKTQALNILGTLQKTLKEKGLTFREVLMLRVYVAPDKYTGQYDYKGWNEAYSQFFGTKENPTKPIRSTIGVAGLVSADKFIEIELVAVYP
ncbi:RidA family protein [Rhabdobacter roseus]|uniref:Enamine deaminase RidA (YjgF/YER057c/UK114 family) n=1 Tax=Rhabdobacter roseus TaxID=1655419 RepID=A0A840TMN0_9BACT|nr:Rid family hydrolase [Rhabdobacter roseus]MBB5285516.1 enamine deaminase RidA (YjgF/YER057c/UK114 family) [Rhabdobacter roseus]